MTPIKAIVVVGTAIYTEDWAGLRELQCVGASPEKAEWVAAGLSKYHKVDVFKIE